MLMEGCDLEQAASREVQDNPGEHRQPQLCISRVINGSAQGLRWHYPSGTWIEGGEEDAIDSLVCLIQCCQKYFHLLTFFFFFFRQLTMTWAHTGKSVIFSAMTLTGKCD